MAFLRCKKFFLIPCEITYFLVSHPPKHPPSGFSPLCLLHVQRTSLTFLCGVRLSLFPYRLMVFQGLFPGYKIPGRGGSRHSQHSQLRMSDFPSLIIPIIMLKVMNELRFKIQDKHIFIYHVFKVFISTPSLYSIYFTPFCLCETFLDLLR